MEEYEKLKENFVHLARIALSNRPQDVQKLLHKITKQDFGDDLLSSSILDLLRKQPTRSSPLRRNSEMAVPVDTDSRFQLLRIEEHPVLPHEPIYELEVETILMRLVEERSKISELAQASLEPTKTVIFTGPPGVGKTLAARWLARELERPLLILDLSVVMSSYLGRTGSNLRHVLDYAKSIDCVLLLDELDAIAKRRDDATEIGELKRLVTVLLQQLDEWPSSGLLVSATNHSELLDPAVWRRFEQMVDFRLPERSAARAFIMAMLQNSFPKAERWADALSISMAGKSFNDIERAITIARRSAALDGKGLESSLAHLLHIDGRPKRECVDLAVQLVKSRLTTQREAHEITGVARDTIRKHMKPARTPTNRIKK